MGPPAAPPIDRVAAPSGPGRFVKVPVGYVYIAAAAVLLVVVVAYMYGYSSGEQGARERSDQKRIDEANALAALPEVDPLNAGKLPPSLSPPAGAGTRQPAGAGGNTGPAANVAANRTTDTDLGPAPGTDPRQRGLNYFVLAHVEPPYKKAEEMLAFCRSNGLDAHLIPDDTGKRRILIVVPGFAAGERLTPAVRALESKIRAVGLKWAAAPGNRDFMDAYPKKHQ